MSEKKKKNQQWNRYIMMHCFHFWNVLQIEAIFDASVDLLFFGVFSSFYFLPGQIFMTFTKNIMCLYSYIALNIPYKFYTKTSNII